MTHASDDLRELWNLDSGVESSDAREVLREFEHAANRFDRIIRLRDLREAAAGLLVAAVFIWLAVHDRTALERVGHGWLAACGIWIIFYIRRFSQASRRPAPEQTLLGYQHELLDRYDRQIRLLKSAKYWYILPFWAGLMFSASARLARTGDLAPFILEAGLVTAVNAVLWWLNERIGVACLENRRGRLLGLTENEGASE